MRIVASALAIVTFCLILALTLVFQLSRVNERTLHDAGFFARGLEQVDAGRALSATASGWLGTTDSPNALQLWLANYLTSLVEDALESEWVDQTKEGTSRELAAYFSGERDQLLLTLSLTQLKEEMSRIISERWETEWADWASSLLLPSIPDEVRTDDLGKAFPQIEQMRRISLVLSHEMLGWALVMVLILSSLCLACHRLRAIVYLTFPIAVAGWFLLMVLPYLNGTSHISLASTEMEGAHLRPLLFSLKDQLMETIQHTAWRTAIAGTLALGIALCVNIIGDTVTQ